MRAGDAAAQFYPYQPLCPSAPWYGCDAAVGGGAVGTAGAGLRLLPLTPADGGDFGGAFRAFLAGPALVRARWPPARRWRPPRH